MKGMKLKVLGRSGRRIRGNYRRPVLSGKSCGMRVTLWGIFVLDGIEIGEEISEGVQSDAGT